MHEFPAWKIWSVVIVITLGVLFSMPNLFTEQQLARLPSWLPVPTQHLNLGLDLRGGSHILLEADPDDIRQARLEALEEITRTELRQAEGGAIVASDIAIRDGAVSFNVRNEADVSRAVREMRRVSRPVGLTGAADIDVAARGTLVTIRPTEAGIAAESDQAMGQAAEVLRRRIDEMGTREPTIVRQGTNRIVVQVPGLEDPDALKALLGKTAKLEFRLVDMNADPALAAQGRAPPGSQVVPNADDDGFTVVERRAIITGDQLIDSQPTYEQGIPVVSFRFDSVGGRRFAKATQENVGRPFAIILDGKVISAPRINSPILGGSGIIQGSFTTQSANELAVLLRSGKLPVALTVIEERTVGPDLGADSIRAGAIASVLATVAVAIFMILTYGLFGVFSVVALIVNAILIIGAMSALGATLTLPGIAGFVLTVGAAVDANVLINERIREELRAGRNVSRAIDLGYTEAQRTIFDANLTNVIAALVMFWLGQGPIKGFAVVLTIGVITSVYTAVTITRLMVALWLRRTRPQKLIL